MTERQLRYLSTALLLIPLALLADAFLRPIPLTTRSLSVGDARELIYPLICVPILLFFDLTWYHPQILRDEFRLFRSEVEKNVTEPEPVLSLDTPKESSIQEAPVPIPSPKPKSVNRNLVWWVGAAILGCAIFLAPIGLCSIVFGSTKTAGLIPTAKTANGSSLPSYTLIDKELGSNTKCILDIRLSDRIEESQIYVLAEHLRDAEGAGCSPLFIFYFLPGDVPGTDIAWAYSHYNPDLEVKINALDLPTKATLEAAAVGDEKNVVGVWIDSGMLPNKIIIRKINGSYEMTTLFSDGSKSTKPLAVKVVAGEERLYEDIENYYGDYMIIKENGYLAFYDNAGFIKEFPPE